MKVFFRLVVVALAAPGAIDFAIAQVSADVHDKHVRPSYRLVPCSKGTKPAACTTDDLQQDLTMAIADGSKDDVLRVLTRLKNVNFIDASSGRTPLSLATRRGSHEIVATLLEKGADPLAVDRHGRPFLYTDIAIAYSGASELGPEVVECVRMILEKASHLGRLPLEPPLDASVVFYPSARKPSLELLKLFLAHGAKPNRKGWYLYNVSPLDEAIAKDNLKAIRIMVEPGTRISRSELDEKAFDALVKNKAELLAIFRAAGADPKRHINANPNILFGAVSPEGSIEVLEFLLKNGADPNVAKHEKIRDTPIFGAGFDPEKMRLLLKYGADPNFKGSSGYTILARVLFHHGKDITIRASTQGQTPLVYSKASLVALLLDHGADLNANNGGEGQWGALGLARREDKEVVDLLVKRGATLRYEIGGPTLMEHVMRKERESSNDKDKGPITLAIVGLERDDLALALIKRDGKVGPKDQGALLEAVRRGWADVAQALLRTGADPNAGDKGGSTPLAMAERRRDKALVKMLVAAGAKPSPRPTQRYKIEAGGEFETAVAIEIDDVIFLDPPRFYLGRSEETSFAVYGKGINQFEEVKCERAVSFKIFANAGEAGGISAGVCTQEAKHLHELAASANQSLDMLLDQLIKGGMKLDKGQLSKFGWVFERKTGPDRSEVYYFPVIMIGHGILPAPTVVLVSKNSNRAVIVQANVMNLCDEGRMMQNQTPLCIDTKGAITDITQRLFARFGEQ